MSIIKHFLKQYNLTVIIVLFCWATCTTLYLLVDSLGKDCPYSWHGGSPTHKGSCWCGASDKYCMCTPSLAIDAIIEIPDAPEPSIILVRRRDPPRKYAIPGGFVDIGETIESATLREVLEETGLNPVSIEQFAVYSDPKRDKRRHTVSVVFRCKGRAGEKISAGDDAKSVEVVPLSLVQSLDLAFDHRQILKDFIEKYHRNVQ